MAVEIPVVIDIDKAFKDAANRVDSAIRPFQRKVDDATGNLKLKVGVEMNESGTGYKNIEKTIKEITGVQKKLNGHIYLGANMQELLTALESAKTKYTAIMALEQKGVSINQAKAKALQEAIVILTAEVEARQHMTELVERSTQAQIAQTRAIEAGEAALNTENTTITQINNKIAELRTALLNLPKNKEANLEWRMMGSEIQKATAKLAEFEAKYTKVTTKPGSINRLNAEMQALIQKWDAMSKAQKFDKDGNLKKSAQKIIDKFKELTKESEKYGRSLQSYASAGKTAIDSTTASLQKQGTVFSQLKSMAGMYFSVFGGLRFVQNIRNVTAELEMQRVALGGILQDTQKAETLFSQIKAAALKSPFEIKDLLTFTKQLSAYRIETDKLFDVTMRLADVSAGLGVDMNRLILAYGQVRAASVLRGQELRQFTEAGIPLVELLAQKFSTLKNQMVSTADVFELISKRAVPFRMIEEIFNDMTNAGGIFYKMQEKQSETLKGQWMKLKDAVTIMYDEIGNTGVVNAALKGSISLLNNLARSWRTLQGVMVTLGASYGIAKIIQASTLNLARTKNLLAKSSEYLTKATEAEKLALKTGAPYYERQAKKLNELAIKYEQAALSGNRFKQIQFQIAHSLRSLNWWQIIITALASFVAALTSTNNKLKQLKENLAAVKTQATSEWEVAERNFKRLADTAVGAAAGTVEQREALEELKRTYQDIVPEQDIQIAKLRSMNHEYSEMTEAIRQNIFQKAHEQNIQNILTTYGETIGAETAAVEKGLREHFNYSAGEARKFVEAIKAELKEGGLLEAFAYGGTLLKGSTAGIRIAHDFQEQFDRIFEKYRLPALTDSQLGDMIGGWSKLFSEPHFKNLVEAIREQTVELNEELDYFKKEAPLMGKFSEYFTKLKENLQNGPTIDLDKASFAWSEAKIKDGVEKIKEAIYKAFRDAGVYIWDYLSKSDELDFEKLMEIIEKNMNKADKYIAKSFLRSISKVYQKLVPSDPMVNIIKDKFKEISSAVGVSMDALQGYLKDGEQTIQDYVKGLNSSLEEAKALLSKMLFTNLYRPGKYSSEDIKQQQGVVTALTQITQWLSIFTTTTKKTSDVVSKHISDITNAYKKFLELRKYKSETEALLDINTLFPQLKGWKPTYENMILKLEEMLTKYKGNADATRLIEQAISNIKFENLKDEIKDKLNKISSDIKRSEVARNFYNDILGMTGDEELAASLTFSIYGQVGKDFKDRLQQEFIQSLEAVKPSIGEDLFNEMSGMVTILDFDSLREKIKTLPTELQPIFNKLLEENEKYDTSWLKDMIKSYDKFLDYENRKNIVRAREQQKRDAIASNTRLTQEQRDEYKKASEKKEEEEIASIELERIKNTDEWVKSFENLDKVSTTTLKKLATTLKTFIQANKGKATPQDMKTVVDAYEKIITQISNRGAYITLIEGAKEYAAALSKLRRLEKEGKKDTEEYKEAQNEVATAQVKMQESIKGINDAFNALSSVVSSLSDLLNLDELSDGQAVLEGIADGIKTIGTAIMFVNAILTLAKLNPTVLAITAIAATLASVVNIFTGTKAKRMEREIKRQQKIIDDLTYSYSRLEKEMESAFGSEYISAYNAQLENLLAQQEAYQKQAEAERNKGKKKDKDKIKQYEEAARDTADKIKDMQSELSEFFAGTNVSSAAEDFAKSWIAAYQEFGNTTDAIKQKFQDLIQNMVVKSLAAQVIKDILQPVFDSIQKYSQDGQLTALEIADISRMSTQKIQEINTAMNTLMSNLAASGVNLRGTVGSLTGISKDHAGASEESIQGLAAGVNSALYYFTYLPQISENVTRIVELLGGNPESVPGRGKSSVSSTEYYDQMLFYMASVPRIEQNIAEMLNTLRSVITPKAANTNTHCIAIK